MQHMKKASRWFARPAHAKITRRIVVGVTFPLFLLLLPGCDGSEEPVGPGAEAPSLAVISCGTGCSIQTAVNGATAGDIIEIAAGTFVENVVVNKDLTLRGAGAGATIVDGGAAGTVFRIPGGVTVTIEDMTIANGASSDGGGIVNDGTLTVANSTITGNTSSFLGGGIRNRGALTLTSSTVVGNTASSDGGISNFSGGTVELISSVVSLNSATFFAGIGGGITNRSGTVTLTNSVVTNNNAPGDGGGIFNFATLVLTESTVSGNTAGSDGGGISNQGGPAAITLTTVSDNDAGRLGGGIFNSGGAVDVTNSTVSGNTAASTGGGILNLSGTLTLANATIAFNQGTGSSSTGGVMNFGVGVTTTKNTIIAGNVGTFRQDCFGPSGSWTSQGHNIIGNAGGCPFTATTGDLLNTNPLLGPLANNGGPTLTHALLDGSPAIDAGNPAGCTDADGNALTTDQRSSPRPTDGDGDLSAVCDVGAFEAPAAGPVVLPVTVDIKPGSDPNSVNTTSKGAIPVAILTTASFDAADVAPGTVTLGDDDGNDTPVATRKKGSLRANLEDVDGDGKLDMILHFDTQALVANGDLTTGTTELILNGENLAGTPIKGSDVVRVVR